MSRRQPKPSRLRQQGRGPAYAFLAVAVLGGPACLWLRDVDALTRDTGADRGDAATNDATGPGGGEGGLTDGGAADGITGDVAGPHCEGREGAVPVRVPDAGFCIDRTETTRVEYSRFVAARRAFATPQDQPPECAWNDSFDPEQDDLNQGSPNAPVAWVDWCDAYAYCAWAGKRLCGTVGDGARLDVMQRTLGGEWFTACSQGGERLFPYGNSFDPNACVGDAVAAGLNREPVATRPGCEGGYPGLFDLSGNVREWENRCFAEDSGAGVGITCAMRGGGFYEQLSDNLRCDNDQVKPANERTQALGIRCCSNWLE